ncbi:NAD(P)/FAD-dependent oxidoreductase [Sulfurimonas lithotrophica]|uniref:NAD(P)/FAD-dependent oxidoreductase n=1 Tax=Sulfurimonas lithotrophica TaxID=2590022 RepID=A0A5P8NXQ3_9BACT|nr:FAD/NAD(P)-binding oxidoreductase [Sulfurimonas lithotrophica]QFR48213.1 NAD(P)/FAD-dependent oxidoreductase [Sulfurimonas lithotrophica]
MSKNQILEEILNEVDKHPEIMSRRDALKFMSVSPVAASVMAGTTVGAASAVAADVKGKIVIVGGGLAGMSTAARLNNSISNADITVIEPDPTSVSYQPGQTLVGAGIWDKEDIIYNRDDFLPSGVKLIKGSVTAFDPDNNSVTVDGSKEVKYDQMIIATGVMLNYAQIKGLEGEITSSGTDNSAVKNSGIGKDGLHSIYFRDGAEATYKGIEELIAKAKAHKGPEKLQAVFTHPNTPIKCGGAPKKIMYLTNSRLEEAGVRDKVELTFYPNGGGMFGIKDYHTAIVEQFKTRGFKWHYKHNLIEVDTATKTAVFDKHWKEKGAYDEDLEEYTMVTKHERVEVKYDFMHITPPMKAPDVVGNSAVGSAKGWVPVNKETLQHVKYPNVWSLGDVAAVPMGKTGGSARKQYKVVVDNMIAAMQGKSLTAKYDGYTVCPLITSIGTVMLAEFNWASKPAGSGKNAASFPLDPTQERWIWWLLKVYALKPMTIHGMLSGRA